MIHFANKTYEVLVDHKNGWKFDAFRERYSEVLDRYDYIVGDWGYNQLRLRGFFKDNHPKATKDTIISTIEDYLNEYCNFGCAYFIIEKTGVKPGSTIEPGNEDSIAEEDGEGKAGQSGDTDVSDKPVILARHQGLAKEAENGETQMREQNQVRQAPSYGNRHRQGQLQGRGQQQQDGSVKEQQSQGGGSKQHGSYRGRNGQRQGQGVQRHEQSNRAQGSVQQNGQNRDQEQGNGSSGRPNKNQTNSSFKPKPKSESPRVEA